MMGRGTKTRAPLLPLESFREVRSHSPGQRPQSRSTARNTRRLEENSEERQIGKEEISLAQLLLRWWVKLTHYRVSASSDSLARRGGRVPLGGTDEGTA